MANQWAPMFARLATEKPFRAFVFWTEHHTLEQVETFAREGVPATRAMLG